MTPRQVKDYYGSGYKFAQETGMSHCTLGNWLKWGFVPIRSQYRLQEITKGELVADWKDAMCKSSKG